VRRITDCVRGQLTPGLTSWQVPDGPNLAEHLAGVTADQRVLLYYWW